MAKMTYDEFRKYLTQLINRIKSDRAWDQLSWANRYQLNSLEAHFDEATLPVAEALGLTEQSKLESEKTQ